MKNCPGCEREVDKHAIACQYCGRVVTERGKNNLKGKSKIDPPNISAKDKKVSRE